MAGGLENKVVVMISEEMWVELKARHDFRAKEFAECERLVRECLEEDKRCRNDDKWLILHLWQKKQHIKCFIPYEELGKMYTPETITRIRRKIQNENGEFLPTDPNILVRRKVDSEVIRSFFGEKSPVFLSFQAKKYKVV